MSRQSRKELIATRKANIARAVGRFPFIAKPGIAVMDDGQVVEMTLYGDIVREVGPVAGASAEVTHGNYGGNPYGGGLAKATAFVKFADGTCLERKLTGALVRTAQEDAVKFNHLVATASEGRCVMTADLVRNEPG
jgi:hypothetical protein